ncbi:MAG: class I SAM-dependent methyltransferase [Myxococcaceae bacterium]|nr:class I SAM-dependent methyltransferase [Myxococcaceae bacterium]
MASTPDEPELERIRAEYARREREIPAETYAYSNPPNLFLRQVQERTILSLLRDGGYAPFADRRLLDVGCGDGGWLGTYLMLGFRDEHLAGIDLDPQRVAEAKARHARSEVVVGKADALPWPDGTFDLVSQFTMFSSILDPRMQERVAREMLRVLKPGGAVLWLDIRYDNPRNKNVVGLNPKRVAELFPGCEVRSRRSTLAPPIARAVVGLSWTLAAVLEQLTVLNVHTIALIRPRGDR